MNQDSQSLYDYHTKKTILHALYKQGQLSFIEFYDSLLSLFEAHQMNYAK